MQTELRIAWILLDPQSGQVARVGDLISAQAGGLPIYRLTKLEERRAWLRDVNDDSDHIMPVGLFHWKAVQAPV